MIPNSLSMDKNLTTALSVISTHSVLQVVDLCESAAKSQASDPAKTAAALAIQMELASEIAKCHHLRAFNSQLILAPNLIIDTALRGLFMLSVLEIRNNTLSDDQVASILKGCPRLTVLNLFTVGGLTGFWWLEHQTLESFNFTAYQTISSKEADLNLQNSSVEITGGRLPRLVELSIDSRKLNGIVPDLIRVSNMQHVKNIVLCSARSIFIESNPAVEVRTSPSRRILLPRSPIELF